MDKWTYASFSMWWEERKDVHGKKYNTWVCYLNDGSQLEGLVIILNHFGAQGWELVNVVTEVSRATGAYGGGADTQVYRAFFKKKVE